MKKCIESFFTEPSQPSAAMRKVNYSSLGIRLAVPEAWRRLSAFSFASADDLASISISALNLPGPMDAQAVAAQAAESSGWQLLAFRQLGSRDDAETLSRQAGHCMLLRVVKVGPKHWTISARWDAANFTDMNLLRAAIRSFHGDASEVEAKPVSFTAMTWDHRIVPVSCPAGWYAPEEEEGVLRPLDGRPCRIRFRSAPPATARPSLFDQWRSEIERDGYTVYAAPVAHQPDSPTCHVRLMAERDGQLFDAPAALSEFADGSLLLSFLAPAWSTSPETAALTQRACADFALAIADALRRA